MLSNSKIIKFLQNRKIKIRLYILLFLISIPLLTLVGLTFLTQNRAISFGKKEIVGLNYNEVVFKIIIELNKIELNKNDSKSLNLNKIDESLFVLFDNIIQLEKKYSSELKTKTLFSQIQVLISNLKSETDIQNQEKIINEIFEKLFELNSLVGDSSNLILDPDLDSYYLMDITLIKLPMIVLKMIEVEKLILEIYADKKKLNTNFILLFSKNQELNYTIEQTKNSYQVTYRYNLELKKELEQKLENNFIEMENYKNFLNLFSKQDLTLNQIPNFEEFEKISLSNFSNIEKMYNETLVLQKKLLEDRIYGFRKEQFISLGFISLILLITLYLQVLIIKSIVVPLTEVTKKFNLLSTGKFKQSIVYNGKDEMKILADSFNKMVASIRKDRAELKNYAENLEEKVNERTKEVQEKMDEVNKLKVQQDGDYFLTSLLTKPLIINSNNSDYVKTEFLIKQKKSFEFKNKKVELGGDICITGNLKLGTRDEIKSYTLALNADAMGKSMQGAGGSIVLGVVVNSILSRTTEVQFMNKTPEIWLKELYHEVHSIFKSFSGSMVISAVIMLVEEQTGEIFYFNAEHPYSVLYRDKKARFIEDKLNLRKLGLDSEILFEVFNFKLEPGDVVLIGSDGRDDIDLTPNEVIRNINEDESLFLEHVEKNNGDLEKILSSILNSGDLIDDFSLLRIGYKEVQAYDLDSNFYSRENNKNNFNSNEIYAKAKNLFELGNLNETKKFLEDQINENFQLGKEEKIISLLSKISLKLKDYEFTSKILKIYLDENPENDLLLSYYVTAEKKLGNYKNAFEVSKKLNEIHPENILNLLNLADLNKQFGFFDESITLIKKVLELSPDNKTAKKLLYSLEDEIKKN